MGFLMSEMISYAQTRVDSISDLESRCVPRPGRRLPPCSTPRLIRGALLPTSRLSSLGHQVGLRILSLLLLRNIYGNAASLKVRRPRLAPLAPPRVRPSQQLIPCTCRSSLPPEQDPKREHRLIPTLQFIHTQVYRAAFGRPADSLEKSFGGEDECASALSEPSSPCARLGR